MEKIFLLSFLFNAFLACAFRKRLSGSLLFIQALPAIIGAGTAIYQGIQARNQRRMADTLKQSNGVPGALKEAESMARMEAQSTATPGYVRGLSRIEKMKADAINNAKRLGNPNAIRGAVVDTNANATQLAKDLEVNNEAARQQSNQRLQNILMKKGAYEKEAFDNYNAAVSALKGAAAQNTFNAINTFGEGMVRSLPDSAFDGSARTARLKARAERAMDRVRNTVRYNPNVGITEADFNSTL